MSFAEVLTNILYSLQLGDRDYMYEDCAYIHVLYAVENFTQ